MLEFYDQDMFALEQQNKCPEMNLNQSLAILETDDFISKLWWLPIHLFQPSGILTDRKEFHLIECLYLMNVNVAE